MRRQVTLLERIDWMTVALIVTLAIVGWLNVSSATASAESVAWYSLDGKQGKQLMWMGICLLLAIAILNIEGEFFIRTSVLYYFITLIMLAVVLVVGKKVGGARAWFGVGTFGIQPSEFAKSGTALMLAWLLSRSDGKLRDLKTRMQALVVVGLPVALILLQPDAGTMLVFGGFIFALYREGLSGNVLIVVFASLVIAVASILAGASTVDYLGWGPASGIYLLLGVAGFMGLLIVWLILKNTVPRRKPWVRRVAWSSLLGGMFLSIGIHWGLENLLQSHQRERIHVLFGLDVGNPDADYNIRHAKAAIGSGGWTGKGYMQGPMTAYEFVPEQETDFIFCTVGEEWGFLGSAFVVLLFWGLLLRLVVLAERQRSLFTRIYAYGVASILFMHFLINIGMVLGLAPVIGIPLPYFSYGGSSMLGVTVLLFVLLRLDAERFTVMS
jgi:rod shape determining protein RodA